MTVAGWSLSCAAACAFRATTVGIGIGNIRRYPLSDIGHQINLALRTAAGHARAANDALAAAEGTYEMKMKSAGASVWEAWGLAVRAQPEYHGRKLDDKALVRIYESTKARPWWDRHLSAVKFAGKPVNREWAKRTLQWHTDPDAARARRAKDAAVSAANRKKVKEKSAAAAMTQGRRRPQAEPTTAEMREVGKAAELGMGFDEQPAPYVHGAPGNYATPRPTDEALRLLARMRHAVEAMTTNEQLTDAAAILTLAAEGLEAL
jgi:hypothetical protein